MIGWNGITQLLFTVAEWCLITWRGIKTRVMITLMRVVLCFCHMRIAVYGHWTVFISSWMATLSSSLSILYETVYIIKVDNQYNFHWDMLYMQDFWSLCSWFFPHWYIFCVLVSVNCYLLFSIVYLTFCQLTYRQNLKWHPMPDKWWESSLPQTLHVHVTMATQRFSLLIGQNDVLCYGVT